MKQIPTPASDGAGDATCTANGLQTYVFPGHPIMVCAHEMNGLVGDLRRQLAEKEKALAIVLQDLQVMGESMSQLSAENERLKKAASHASKEIHQYASNYKGGFETRSYLYQVASVLDEALSTPLPGQKVVCQCCAPETEYPGEET